MDWFLYDNGPRPERVKYINREVHWMYYILPWNYIHDITVINVLIISIELAFNFILTCFLWTRFILKIRNFAVKVNSWLNLSFAV